MEKKLTDEFYDRLETEYFEELEELSTNSPEYCITQGQLYEELWDDERVSETEALHVTTHLNNGKIGEAKELTEELLEP